MNAGVSDVTGDMTRRTSDGALALLLLLIVLLSTGSFSPELIDASRNDLLQQALVEVLWIAVVAIALPRLRLERYAWDPRIGAIAAFVFYGALSSLWSSDGVSAMMKGGAMTFNILAVFLLAAVLRFEVVVGVLVAGLALLDLASLALVILMPDIGLVQTWQHAGQWSGVFEQKQTLGITSAMLLYLTAMRLPARGDLGWRALHLAIAALATACILGSGSRGGGGLALAAAALGFFSDRSRLVRAVAAVTPVLASAVALGLLSMLVVSDRDVLNFGAGDVDLTDRTRIWKHALDWVGGGNLIFGSGLNGFWSRKDVADAFWGGHGWFLDNYHNGYLAVLGDCGLVGVVLLAAVTLSLASAGVGNGLPRETSQKNLSMGFVALFYLINVTETYLLRSTNLAALIFFFFAFRLLSTEAAAPAEGTDENPPAPAPAVGTPLPGPVEAN